MSQIFLFVRKVHLYIIDKLAHNTGCYQLPDAAAPKCAQRYSLPSFVIPGCARFSRCRSQQRVEITENYFYQTLSLHHVIHFRFLPGTQR